MVGEAVRIERLVVRVPAEMLGAGTADTAGQAYGRSVAEALATALGPAAPGGDLGVVRVRVSGAHEPAAVARRVARSITGRVR